MRMTASWQSLDNAAVSRRSADGALEAFADVACRFPLAVDCVDPFGDVCAWPALGLKYASRDHGERFRVFLAGADVSARCFAADDRFGYAVLFEPNDQGNLFLRHHPSCPNLAAGDKIRFSIVDNPDTESDPANPNRKLVAIETVPCHPGCGVAVRLEVGDVVIVPWDAVKNEESDKQVEP